jgi:hypothetical protein
LGEITVIPPGETTLLRKLAQNIGFILRSTGGGQKSIAFVARKPNPGDVLTMEMLEKYGVLVFGNAEDVKLLLKVGKI